MEDLFERTILIVDDEAINRELLGNIIQSEYKVIYAADGKEALEKIHSKGNTISLVLLDLLMPVMDGNEVLKTMNDEGIINEIPVIVLTSEKSSEIESLKLGAADFLTKPYDLPEVILAALLSVTSLRTVIVPDVPVIDVTASARVENKLDPTW